MGRNASHRNHLVRQVLLHRRLERHMVPYQSPSRVVFVVAAAAAAAAASVAGGGGGGFGQNDSEAVAVPCLRH